MHSYYVISPVAQPPRFFEIRVTIALWICGALVLLCMLALVGPFPSMRMRTSMNRFRTQRSCIHQIPGRKFLQMVSKYIVVKAIYFFDLSARRHSPTIYIGIVVMLFLLTGVCGGYP